jgi:hypothetical protein
MKKDTTIEQMINMLKSVEDNTHSIYSDKVILRKMINFLESWMPDERRKIEKAFEDGVGEGLTDPERPFTGKEYFDVKYKKQ